MKYIDYIIGVFGICGIAFLLGMDSVQTSAAAECRPPRTEYERVVATLERNNDGVLELRCNTEEIVPYGVQYNWRP